MNDRQELLSGWVWTPLEEVCDVILGQSPPSETYNSEGIGLPFYQGKTEFGKLYPTPVKWCSQPHKIAHGGDILISVRAPVGPTNLCQEDSCIGRGLAAIRSHAEMPNKYFLYYLRFIEKEWDAKATGTTFKAISGDTLKGELIPVAPPVEQHRIVAKIEELFSDLDAATASLQRARANLKRYRQSVLQAAVTGELTREWRESHRAELEPAGELLKLIQAERRARWEADLRSKGKDPAKVKYEEPKGPDVNGLLELPEGWTWATLSELTSQIVDVDHKMPKPADSEIAYISTKDFIGTEEINYEDAKKISDNDYVSLCRKVKPELNDILLSRYGTVGEVRKVKTDRKFQASYSIAIIKTLNNQTLNNFLVFSLRSKHVQDQIHKYTRATAQPDLGLAHIKLLLILVPSIEEQQFITIDLDRINSIISEQDMLIEKSLERANRLRLFFNL